MSKTSDFLRSIGVIQNSRRGIPADQVGSDAPVSAVPNVFDVLKQQKRAQQQHRAAFNPRLDPDTSWKY
jgi:hypothetical protein